MAPCRIILADNHPVLRKGLRRILDEQPGVEVCAEAGEGGRLLDLIAGSGPGPLMVVIDPSLPDLLWTEAIRRIKALRPETRVLVLSMHDDVEYLTRALAAGAEGYLVKDCIGSELAQAVSTINQGGVYVSQALQPLLPGPG